jgi:NAD(P)-dependent dehydrogenase (short-subunit alcohol dehydrogenase family)
MAMLPELSRPLAVTLLLVALVPLLFSNATAQQRADVGGRKVALVTGSTDGLGREVALRLGAAGYHVIVHGRNAERGAAVVTEINSGGRGSARFHAADFASLAQVRQLVETIRRDYTRLHVLVNNAGVWLNGGTRQLSADGHEMHFAVNYLAGYLLTRTLLPMMGGDTAARIINVASVGQQPLQFDNIMLATGYSDSRGYSQSKLAQIMFTFDLAEELRDRKILVNAVHPSTMMNTTMVLSRGSAARSSVDTGAEAVLNLITTSDQATGQYYNVLRPGQANAQAYDAGARAQLRALSQQLTGIR